MKAISSFPLLGLSLAALVSADASSNYTEYLLSSGTIKLGEWQTAFDKAAAFVKTLNQTEKISFIAGGDAGGINALNKLDSSTNPLTYYYVTTWPAGSAMAMTWDRDAISGQGAALGSEFRGKGINLAYAPTLEPLGRSAWCGRTGETYGPDTFLNGAMGGNFVKGMSSVGVIPSAKHFILNEFETNRLGSNSGGPPGGMGTNSTSTTTTSTDSYNVVVDDKAFHETYLFPFYDAVKNGIGGAMCAMNRVNSTYSCENQDLLAKYLKVELGFPGIVHADVGGQKTAVNSANAGMDFSSGNTWSSSSLGPALANGSLSVDRLDDMVIRNVMGFFKLGQDAGYPSLAGSTDHVDVRGNHSALARSYAADSIVLLKNTNNALPLKNKTSLSIFGYHAAPRVVGPSTTLSVYGGVNPTMLGHMAQVGGSAMGSLAYLTTPFQLFNERAVKDGFMLKWWLSDEEATSSALTGSSGTEIEEDPVGIARLSDACVVFLNAWSGEGGDRTELTNNTQDALVNTVADTCNNTIVVINTTGPRLVDAWINHENITGVIYGGPLGQESGNAIDDVLFGAVNPSGRLIHTIAKNESDYDPNTRVNSTNLELAFTEGNYIDYKYFDQYNITPRYEFGYGLSYTTFEYDSTITAEANSNLTAGYASGALAVGGREDLWDIVATVSGTVTNTGSIAGAEVAQLYVTFPDVAGEPVRQLRGFEKVMIQPGETADITFTLKKRDLSIWDTLAQNWKVESGDYTFYMAASSRDLKGSTTLTV